MTTTKNDRFIGVKILSPKGVETARDRRQFVKSIPLAQDPVKIKMPCGAKFEWTRDTLPIEDLPCPCGLEAHCPIIWEVSANA